MVAASRVALPPYRDVAGVNSKTTKVLTAFETSPGICTYYDPPFFPIYGELFANQGRSHNYHFTTEIKTTFTYEAGAGQDFAFTGDDDVFVSSP